MFKNFDKVFGFTFRNQAGAKSYKLMTFITAIILFVAPIAILLLIDKFSGKDEGEKPLEACGASYIYVVDTEKEDVDLNYLSKLGIENYKDLKYVSFATVDEALKKANEQSDDILVLSLNKVDGGMKYEIIIPKNSVISEDDAKNFDKFLQKNAQSVIISTSGLNMSELGEVAKEIDSDVYTTEGYATKTSVFNDKETSDEDKLDSVKPVFGMILIFIVSMLLYFIILTYGSSITQNVVLEKSSKLMDTMLVSVRPEALVFGKLCGVISAGFIQLILWVASFAGGLFTAFKVIMHIHPDADYMVITFLKGLGKMGIFKPVNVIIAVAAMLVGVLFYCGLSAIAGAISNNKEEAASNQSIFVIVLVLSFYAVLFLGIQHGGEVPLWMNFVPSIAAMVLPAALSLGTINMGLGLLAFTVMLICTLLLIILSGKIYKMMSLYKGNKVNLTKALKMVFSKQ